MSFILKLNALFSKMTRGNRLGQGLILGMGLTLVGMGSHVQAAETITLRYLDDTVTTSLGNLQTFASTGVPQLPDLQAFAEEHPQVATLVQDILTAEIYISPEFLEDTLDSSTGEFVLIQLNKFLSDPNRSDDLSPIRTALLASFDDDNRFSLLEVVEEYPEAEILVDLSGLEPVYNDVKGFIEDVLPALEVAKGFLQDLLCDCEAPAADASTTLGGGDGDGTLNQTSGCVQSPTEEAATPAAVETDAIAESTESQP